LPVQDDIVTFGLTTVQEVSEDSRGVTVGVFGMFVFVAEKRSIYGR